MMTISALVDFLRGGTMVALLGIALFFFRFWRDSADRLFAYFCASFVILALSHALILFLGEGADLAPYSYWVRLGAFALIIIGIVEKNLPS